MKPEDWKNLTDEEKSRCMHSFMEDPRFNWLLNQAHEITGIDYDPALAEAALGSEPNRSAAYILMASRMWRRSGLPLALCKCKETLNLDSRGSQDAGRAGYEARVTGGLREIRLSGE